MCLLIAGTCAAGEAISAPKASGSATSVDDFEKQVREVAERTAAEERARMEEAARLAKANTPQKSSEAFRVFKYRKDGATVFTDQVPYKTRYEVIVYNSCYACSLTSTVDWLNTRLHLTEFSDTISIAARQYGVDPALIRAVIHAESAFNPLARSRKGAMGLMQLMPDTAKDMGVADSTNPQQNINGGVKYLAALMQTFNGNVGLVAAAYNAGPGAVTKHGGIPPYDETRTYVKRVKILLERYRSQKVLADAS